MALQPAANTQDQVDINIDDTTFRMEYAELAAHSSKIACILQPDLMTKASQQRTMSISDHEHTSFGFFQEFVESGIYNLTAIATDPEAPIDEDLKLANKDALFSAATTIGYTFEMDNSHKCLPPLYSQNPSAPDKSIEKPVSNTDVQTGKPSTGKISAANMVPIVLDSSNDDDVTIN